MKIKTADLIGPALDWAAAQCKGFKKIRAMPAWSNKHGAHGGPQVMVSNEEDSSFDYRPSSNWSQGGPLIERERINVKSNLARMREHPEYDWLSDCPEKRICVSFSGPTPLIAAMRCLVAANLGDEVDIPDELV